MSLIWRSRLIIVISVVLAVWLGAQLADGGYAIPGIVAAIGVGAVLVRLAGVPLDALVLGGTLLGYFIGNRGFAQVMPIPRIPILPAEFALVTAGAWVLVQSAFSHQLPLRRTALNGVVLLWLLAGSARVIFDVRGYGFLAVRDYAMVYYAAFFFIAQHIAAEAKARRFLLLALLLGALIQPFAALASETFPEFFYGKLTFRGTPLILFKGDLAFTFTAVSALLVAFALPARHRAWAWALATVELLFVIGGANRASMLGAVAALTWLGLSRARKFVAMQAGAVAVAALLVAGLALLVQNDWAERKLAGVTERVISLGDVLGSGTYASEESSMKGDNNRFRSTWWRAVVDETLDRNPAFGLGFGYDLARNFLREYNPDMAEDFTARSPHSIIVSTIGRMGFTGLAVFLVVLAAIVVNTWRAMRDPAADWTILGLWAALWVILVSACFGVVLEGPMGAVVFWSLLGIVSAMTLDGKSAGAAEIPADSRAALQHSASRDEVLASHSRIT